LFKFTKKQRIFDIAGIKLGGQPGQHPTVMIGSIFYHKDGTVKNEKIGQFNEGKAEELLKAEEEMSAKTGNPRIIDVCASYPHSIDKFIDFVADVVEGPFAIDGTTAEVRIAGVKYAEEVGLSNRIVYNSITPETKDAEILAIRAATIKSALLLTLNSTNPTITGRLHVIDGLLKKAEKACIENTLIDTTVMDLPDPGPASKAVYLVKERYGLPAGCGSHNAIAMWHKRRRLDYETYLTSSVVADTLPIAMGANFMVYGPIKNAPRIYVPIAVADAYVSYSVMQEYGTKPSTDNHPIFQIFRT
jgi:tetrahydromethanopterin S-methyltransferase subunit H